MTKNELVVLGLLSEMPMHGYQLYQKIEKRHMEAWAQVNLASVYNTLDRLKRSKMVEAKRERPGKMPEREVFHITAKGKRRLSALVEEALTSPHMPQNDFCVGVAFLFGLPKKKALECLEVKRKQLKAVTAHMDGLRRKVTTEIPVNWEFLVQHGHEHIKQAIKEVDYLKRRLSKLKNWPRNQLGRDSRAKNK